MEWLTVCLAEGMGEEQTVVSLHCAMEFVGSRIVVSLAVASQWWLHNTVERVFGSFVINCIYS